MLNRRRLLQAMLAAGPSLALTSAWSKADRHLSKGLFSAIDVEALGTLNVPDENGIRLPSGFRSRIIAISDKPVVGTQFRWHASPDGGACFKTDDGGWIYVSNCEEWSPFKGGASAIRFNHRGEIADAYRILAGTRFNCSGGATPWGSWLSCEEIDRGSVYECDPTGRRDAIELPALGYFKHEAIAYDNHQHCLYLTEDEKDGCLYRFVPDQIFREPLLSATPIDLNKGRLDVLCKRNNKIAWSEVPNPTPSFWQTRTRYQVPDAMAFAGGEGIWYQNGYIWFTTKRDNRVWQLAISAQTLTVVYDAIQESSPVLRGVDAITATPSGTLLVAEDGDDMQLVALSQSGKAKPLLQVIDQPDSEITGPAFSPDGTRLYFSSQRGRDSAKRFGITYEIQRT